MSLRRLAAFVAMLLGTTSASLAATVPVEVIVSPDAPGSPIPPRFLGLSYETKEILPRPDGSHLFNPTNEPLIRIFRSLGVRSLRVGGNSVDVTSVPVPSESDIDALFAFARAAGVKVIYSVRLKDGDPKSAAAIATLIRARYADLLDCFAIGNEPGYYKPYDNLRPRWRSIMEAIVAAVPDARFCGPDDNPNPDLWRRLFHDFGTPNGPLMTLSLHSYPGGCAYQNPKPSVAIADLIPNDAAAIRERLLSAEMPRSYRRIRDNITAVLGNDPRSFRLTETNSLWYGGLQGASDSHASALWAIEYLFWWAQQGADGVNFHTGDRVGGGERSVVCRYAAFVSADSGYAVRPLGYAMKLFDVGGHGRFIPVASKSDPTALAAFAVRTANGAMCVTLVNKTHERGASTFAVRIAADNGARFAEAQAIQLRAPNDDIAAGAGITLGGSTIDSRGQWSGRWASLPNRSDGDVIVILPPASAAVVRFSLESK